MPADPWLVVDRVSKAYRPRRAAPVPALCNVTLELAKGEILGLAGPSGCGKTTLARCLAGFELPDSGRILLNGRAPRRPEVQLVFQDAAASLNPRFTVEEVLSEPLVIARRGTAASRRQTAAEWSDRIGLPSGATARPALTLSGGERQRLALARALVLEPNLLILDEAFSGVDSRREVQLSALLLELRDSLAFTCIVITHDLGLALRLAQRVAIMQAGEVVEFAPAAEVRDAARHPLTRELLDAARALSLHGVL